MIKKLFSFSAYLRNKRKNNFEGSTVKIFKKTVLVSLIIFVISCGKDEENIQNEVPVIKTQSFNASESITNTETIGTIKATDANSSDKLTFSITTNDNGLFEITNDGKLSLASGKNLDFETTTSHTITVKVTDNEDEASAQITINVVDVNENTAPVIANQRFEIAENKAIDAIIGQIVATDPEGDVLTYSLPTQSTEFSITSTGELKALVVFDYETTASYTLEVSVSDGVLSSTATIIVNVTDVDETNAFITTWKTITANESIEIHTRATESGFTYNYIINWGDGTTDIAVSGNATHTYATASTYKIMITGTFPAINSGISSENNREKLQSIDQWGTISWQTMKDAFKGCKNLKELATDAPNLSNVTDMSGMFNGAIVLNQDISNWDVSKVNDMSLMFNSASAFNQDISGWDVGSVLNMRGMFQRASTFNQNIGDWNVMNVRNMQGMFSSASAFNQDISNWNVSNVNDMTLMFSRASAFNQNIGTWNVSKVTNMASMFHNASAFNQNIGAWNVSKVTNMRFMFEYATAFNQNISSWDVSNVIEMSYMFANTPIFNGNVSNWNVSNVINMTFMFAGTMAFNQDINGWNVSNVTNMYAMFTSANAFNQNISSWDVSKVTNMRSMFQDNTTFNQDLTGWDVANVTNCALFNLNSVLANSNRPNFTNCTP